MRAKSPSAANVEISQRLVQRALEGDRTAVTRLVAELYPIIQRRAAVTLSRYGVASRQDVEDVCQEVMLGLFRDDQRALASWDPERGLSLPQFVGMLAQRRVISYLRSRQQKPQGHPVTDPATLEQLADLSHHHEGSTNARETLQLLADRLRETLSAQGLEMFYRVYVWEQATELIAEEMQLSVDAVYQWRSRLKKSASALLTEITSAEEQ